MPAKILGNKRSLALLLAVCASGAVLPAALTRAAEEDRPVADVVHLRVESIIHRVAAEFIAESLAEADESGAALAVIELDTPGGVLDSMRAILKSISTARTLVVVDVTPSGAQAASAGFFVLMAADVAAMAPGTNTGAAHPVGGQGEDIEGHMGEKVEQDAAASIRSLAKQHGRNVELAEKAVLESRSFTAEEALEGRLIDLMAESLSELLDQIDGREIQKGGETRVLSTARFQIRKVEMAPFEQFRAIVANPVLAYLLMTLGFLGLYFELSNPGAIFPGVIGAICLILAFYAFSVLPVNFAGIALMVLAVILFIAEIKIASFGLLTAGGVLCLILGSLLLFDELDPAVRLGWDIILGVTVPLALGVVLLVTLVVRTHRQKVNTGQEGLVQERGVARSAIAPRGKVFLHGEIWNAVADQPIPAESEVEVVAVEGMRLKVRPVPGTAPEGEVDEP